MSRAFGPDSTLSNTRVIQSNCTDVSGVTSGVYMYK